MAFLIILLLSFLFQMVLPWWIIIVISFGTCGILGKNGKIAFLQSFFAIFLMWIGMALYKSIPNENILASRIAEMLSLKYWPLVVFVTGLIGGLVAGIAGLCGYHFRKAMISIRSTN